MRPIILEDIGHIFTKFSPLVEKWISIINRTLFSGRSRDVAIVTSWLPIFRANCLGLKLLQTFSLGAELSQDLLHQFSQSLHRMVGIELKMINLSFFFQSNVTMATNFEAKSCTTPSFVALPLRNETEYCYVNVYVNIANDVSTSCKNVLNFGPVISEVTGSFLTFFDDRAKLLYPAKYLRI